MIINRSVADCETFEFVCGVEFGDFGVLYVGLLCLLERINKSVKLSRFTFDHATNRTIRLISHPAGDSVFASNLLGSCAKEHPLNAADEDYVVAR